MSRGRIRSFDSDDEYIQSGILRPDATRSKSQSCTAKELKDPHLSFHFHTKHICRGLFTNMATPATAPAPRKVKDTQLYDVLGVAPEATELE